MGGQAAGAGGGTGTCRPAGRELSPCFEAVREAGSDPALTAGSRGNGRGNEALT